LKVLIVENALAKRMKITKAVSGFNCEIESALHFHRAQEMLSQQKFDWVVSNLDLSQSSLTKDHDAATIYFLETWHKQWLLSQVPNDVQTSPVARLFLITNDAAAWSQKLHKLFTSKIEVPIIQDPIDPNTLRHAILTRSTSIHFSTQLEIWPKRAA
jgi:CheY-like chemotaxis protein